MKCRAEIFGGTHELLADGQHHGISRGAIIGPVALFVSNMNPFTPKVFIYHFFGGCGVEMVCRHHGKRLRMPCGQSFALVNVENMIISQQRDFFLLSRLLILLV